MIQWVQAAVSAAILAQVKVIAYSAFESHTIDWGNPTAVAAVALDHLYMPHQYLPQEGTGPACKHMALVPNRPVVHHRLQIECHRTRRTESIYLLLKSITFFLTCCPSN